MLHELSHKGWWVMAIPFLLITAALFVTVGKQESVAAPRVMGGDPARGPAMLQMYGCGSCHVIAGVAGADGKVGPPLSGLADRGYIAGKLPNTPENLMAWIKNPQGIDPGNAMPNMDVSDMSARDIAAYLYTLH